MAVRGLKSVSLRTSSRGTSRPSSPRAPSHPPLTSTRVATPWGVLALTFDAKTAPTVGWSKSGGWKALVPNTFPLPSGPIELGGTCPGATPSCVSCYALRGLEIRTQYAQLTLDNFETLMRAEKSGGQTALTLALGAVIDLAVRLQTSRGVQLPTFRFHSSGDVFSIAHAQAIRNASASRPDVPSWIYTRSLWAVEHLCGVPSLRVFVSVDRHNAQEAKVVVDRFDDVQPAFLVESDEEKTVLLNMFNLVAAPTCPATAKWASDLRGPSYVSGPKGDRRTIASPTPGARALGACDACRLCLPEGPNRPVVFSLHGGKGSLEAAMRVMVKRSHLINQPIAELQKVPA